MPKSLRVNVRRILENFLQTYPYSPEEALIIEAIANSLDAHACRIELTLDENFVVEDDGDGMSEKTFEENFAALAYSEKVKGEGIGWAGVGGKIYLAIQNTTLYIESKTNDGHFAWKVWSNEDDVFWDYVPDRQSKLNHRGTYYEVKLREGHNLTPEKIENIVKRKFNGILLGLYGERQITVNGREIRAFRPELDGEPWDQKTKTKYGTIRFIFWLTKHDLDEPYGVDIIVFGKSIRKKFEELHLLPADIRIKPEYHRRIVVFAIADRLAEILTTNKEDFNASTNQRLWASFVNRLRKTLTTWLKQRNLVEIVKMREFDTSSSVGHEAERILANLLRHPSLRDYNPFLARIKSEVTIPSQRGDLNIQETAGAQQTTGTIGGQGTGGGMPTQGPDFGTGAVEATSAGQSAGKGEKVIRTVRSGLKIGFVSKDPSIESELVGDTLLINKETPQYRLADRKNWILAHIMRCAFFTLIEYRDGHTQMSVKSLLDKLRDFHKVWAEYELQ